MKKKKVISILLTGVLLTGMLAGCGAKGEESASKDKELSLIHIYTASIPKI